MDGYCNFTLIYLLKIKPFFALHNRIVQQIPAPNDDIKMQFGNILSCLTINVLSCNGSAECANTASRTFIKNCDATSMYIIRGIIGWIYYTPKFLNI